MHKNRIIQHLLPLMTAVLFASSPVNGEWSDQTSDCSLLSDFNFNIDLIAWKPCFDELDYAVSFDAPPATIVNGANVTASAKYRYICHNWKPGLRIGIGKRDLFCNVDLIVDYSRINGASKNNTTPETDGTVLPTLAINDQINAVDTISTRHNFTYQSYDILFAQEWTMGNCQVLRPYVGITGMVLSQKIRCEYEGDNIVAVSGDIRWNSNYSGVGFKIGSRYDYAFNNCFGFYANGSGAIVTGNMTAQNRQNLINGSTSSVDIDFKDDVCLFTPGCHIMMGFTYDTCWCEQVFTFNMGYEFLKWYNIATPRRILGNGVKLAHSTSANHTTMGYHGLNVGVTASF